MMGGGISAPATNVSVRPGTPVDVVLLRPLAASAIGGTLPKDLVPNSPADNSVAVGSLIFSMALLGENYDSGRTTPHLTLDEGSFSQEAGPFSEASPPASSDDDVSELWLPEAANAGLSRALTRTPSLDSSCESSAD